MNRLAPERAVLWMPMDGQYHQANGVQLVTDGDMEAVGTAAWPGSVNVTVIKDVTTPHTGTQCLRVTLDTPPFGLALQVLAVTTGDRFRITGWGAGDGAVGRPRIVLGSAVWQGTNSTNWQYFDLIGDIAFDPTLYLQNWEVAAGYCRFDDIRVEKWPRSTRNLGRALGAPEHVQVGNGATTTTFPAQRSPRGMYFDGGDYCRFPLEPFTTPAAPFTMAALMREPNPNSAFSIIDSLDVGLPTLTGIEVVAIAANRLTCALYSTNGSSTFWQSDFGMPSNVQRVNFYCSTYNGSGTGAGNDIYINGANLTTTRSGAVCTGSLVSGQGYGIGTRWNGAATNLNMTGDMYCAAIFPYQLSANEVYELEYRMRQLKGIPR
jgi:hypothetical protein